MVRVAEPAAKALLARATRTKVMSIVLMVFIVKLLSVDRDLVES
jgi:hypothetical protein